MVFPKKNYYFIDEATKKLDCSIRDVLYCAVHDIVKIGVFLDDVHCNITLHQPYQVVDNATITGLVFFEKVDVEKLMHSFNYEYFNTERFPIPHRVVPDVNLDISYPIDFESDLPSRICPWGNQAKDFDPLPTIYPHSHYFVDGSKIIVRELTSSSIGLMNEELGQLPKELSVAIDVFKEFWQDRPQDMNPAPEDLINKYIKEKMGGEVSGAAMDRIRTIARPDQEKNGGAPRSEAKNYRGRSQNPSV
jgi:hypothetical protein